MPDPVELSSRSWERRLHFEFVPEGEASPDPRAYPEATETNDIELGMPCPRGNDFLSPETGQVLRSC
jgi:hypothetical protein